MPSAASSSVCAAVVAEAEWGEAMNARTTTPAVTKLGLTPGSWRFVRYEGEYSVPVHDVVTDYDDERLPKTVARAYQGNENDLRVMALAKEMAEAILAHEDTESIEAWRADQMLLDVAKKLRAIGVDHA